MLTDLIRQVHAESKGTYGIARVHAELTLGRGVHVGHNQGKLLMRRAGLQGVTGRRKWKRIMPNTMANDLVERNFNRSGPNQLWVTDITEHPTPWIPANVAAPRSRGVRDACKEVHRRAAGNVL